MIRDKHPVSAILLLTRMFAGWDEAESERQAGEPLGQGPLHGHLSLVQVGSKQGTAQYTFVRARLRENIMFSSYYILKIINKASYIPCT